MKELSLSLILAISVFILFFDFSSLRSDFSINSVAGVFFKDSINTSDIIKDFETAERRIQNSKRDRIKIMIVPGHDHENTGAVFGDVTEAEINLKLAKEIEKLLEEHKELDVFLARNERNYNNPLKRFIEREADEILEFRQEKVYEMNSLVEEGKVDRVTTIYHNFARPEVVKVLYGINKYVNEEDFDIVLHIHFNDYPGRSGPSGKYKGFSIYTPEKQYSNAKASYDFAVKLKNQLEQILPISDMPKESAIVESQDLIAVGANNSSDAVSVLVEYGYIYETYFTDPEIKDYIFDELAKQTYWGFMNYLRDDSTVEQVYTDFYDYGFENNLKKGNFGIDVLALQAFLVSSGYYPYDATFNECPISGFFGDCTEDALKKFQEENDLDVTGNLNQETIEKIKPEYLFKTVW
jgi:N-acetylmuramoyl-L-alanine amidase